MESASVHSIKEDIRPYITPVVSDIRKEWGWVKIGVNEILAEQPTLTYRPEDIYASCVSGESHLITVENNKFVVLKISTDEFSLDKTLFMWLCWVAPEIRSGENIKEYMEYFLALAKKEGCKYLETGTTTKALGRLYTSIGMELTTMTYRLEIGNNNG
tara:strand:+ start:48 stop:521 length:474 start_codon:yes stop_codon:yes gene_type:complete